MGPHVVACQGQACACIGRPRRLQEHGQSAQHTRKEIEAVHRRIYNDLIAALDDPELSVVIPVYNESPNIARLYEELKDVLGQMRAQLRARAGGRYGGDDTFDQLAGFQARDPACA